jgi:hypothetical protein
VNGLVHVLAEEKMNDVHKTQDVTNAVRSRLRNVFPEFRELFVETAQGSTELSNIDVGNLYDSFINQVAGSEKYTVAFKNFLAVPGSIHAVLILVFILSILIIALLIRAQRRTILNYVTIGVFSLPVIGIISAYVLFFTGNLWRAFQFLSYPLSQPLPTGDMNVYIQKSVQETVKYFNDGMVYLNNVPDPSGLEALSQASETGAAARFIVMGLIILGIAVLLYFNFRKKKGRKK